MATRGERLASFALGASLAFLLDPELGRRRRGRARDRISHLSHQGSRVARMAWRNGLNHARGVTADVRARLLGEEVDDDVLGERVRARLGHLVAHPAALEVSVRGGKVLLSGSTLPDEMNRLAAQVGAVRGVRAVETHLSPRAWSTDGHAVEPAAV